VPLPPPHVGPVTKSVIWRTLRVAGYSQIQVAGVMGNMQDESAFNVEINWPDTNGFHAYGLISWNAAFYPDAPSLVTGDDWGDLGRQVQYLLHHTRRVSKGLRGATPAEVASNWSNYVEHCAGCAFGDRENYRRQAIAVVIYQEGMSGRWG
jgi:hypothetical protein